MRKTTKTFGAVIALAMACLAPVAALAEGHTSEFAGNKGFVGDKGYVGYVAPVKRAHRHGRADAYHGWNRKRIKNVQVMATPACPHGFNGMFRGTLYCIDGRPIQ